MATKTFSHSILTTIRTLLILLFVYTATSKLLHLGQFELRLERMPYLSPMAPYLAVGVPFLELVLVGLLLLPKYQKTALYASLGLLGLFTAYIAFVLNTKEALPCSCGGVINSLGWQEHLWFNGSFMLLALWALILTQNQPNKQQHTAQREGKPKTSTIE